VAWKLADKFWAKYPAQRPNIDAVEKALCDMLALLEAGAEEEPLVLPAYLGGGDVVLLCYGDMLC
jgi:hypothetical protein